VRDQPLRFLHALEELFREIQEQLLETHPLRRDMVSVWGSAGSSSGPSFPSEPRWFGCMADWGRCSNPTSRPASGALPPCIPTQCPRQSKWDSWSSSKARFLPAVPSPAHRRRPSGQGCGALVVQARWYAWALSRPWFTRKPSSVASAKPMWCARLEA
jgi:hypothetical protein